jgi:nitrogen fixation NifU-like protein
MAYSDKVIDHYNNPRNVGQMDKTSTEVGTGLVGAPECGDVMRLQIRVNPETQIIEEAKFKTFGCGSAIASSSLATEWVKGKTISEAMEIKNTDIVKELALPPVGAPSLTASSSRVGDHKSQYLKFPGSRTQCRISSPSRLRKRQHRSPRPLSRRPQPLRPRAS